MPGVECVYVQWESPMVIVIVRVIIYWSEVMLLSKFTWIHNIHTTLPPSMVPTSGSTRDILIIQLGPGLINMINRKCLIEFSV